MNLQQLQEENKGVSLSQVLSMESLSETENLESVEFSGENAKFSFNAEAESVSLAIAGIPENIDVDYSAYVKAMRMAGFPEVVAETYPAAIMMEPLNWGFREKAGRTKMLLKQLSGDVPKRKLITFTKPAAEILSVKHMLELTAELCGGETNTLFDRLDHSLEFTNCSVVLVDNLRSFEDERVERGDIVMGGINWSYSLTGMHPSVVSAFIWRLVCENGMISSEHAVKFSRNTQSVSHLDWFAEAVKSCIAAIGHEFDKVEKLREVILPDGERSDILTGIFTEFGLSQNHRTLAMSRMVEDSPRNMWDVVNAITNVANDAELQDNPQSVRRLQMIGGELATRTQICNTCHAVRRS